MTEDIKLAKASWGRASVNVLDDPTQSGLYNIGIGSIDKLELPDTYAKLIKVCRFFYRRDAVAATVFNKMVDCAITPIKNRCGHCIESELFVYDAITDMLQEFFRNVCLEYLLSGLVIPHYEWERVKGSDLSQDINSRRRITVPNNIWFRDPASVVIKVSTALPNMRKYYVKIDAKTVRIIKSGGVGLSKDDKAIYDELIKYYPEFVKAVKDMKGVQVEIPLEDVRPILGRTLPEDAYPIPYMTNALEALMHKRNLKRMDYSIASRVIGAIQLVKLGSDLFPCTEDSDFDAIKNQMEYRTTTGVQERVYQLFGNHTLQIEWVYPDTAALLNKEKYTIVEDDIIAGLGFPRTLITGETLRSNVAGGSDFAAFSPIATMETMRDKFVEWIKVLYKEIKEKNDFKGYPIPQFEPMRLYKLADLNTIGQSLYLEGNISRTTRQELVGIDFETEIERKKNEIDVMKENGIPEAPQLPFSSPSIGPGNAPKTPQTPPKKVVPTSKSEIEDGEDTIEDK